MKIIYLPEAEKYLDYWVKTGNKAILKKIIQLTKAIIENPYCGVCKPEALRYNIAPKWSRRITNEHRYIYLVNNDTLYVYSLRGHYK